MTLSYNSVLRQWLSNNAWSLLRSRMRAMEEAPFAVAFIEDSSTRILGLNRKARIILGYTENEIPEIFVSDLFDEDCQVMLRATSIANDSCQEWQKVKAKKKDGSDLWLKGWVAKQDSSDESLFFFQEEKEELQSEPLSLTATHELKRELAAARSENEQKSKFLATMSHEMRTPLNAIIGFSQIMNGELLGPIGSEKYKEYAADIQRNGQHLLSLVNDILDLTRLEAAHQALTPNIFFAAQEIESVVQSLASLSLRKGIAIAIEDDAPELLLLCDIRAFRQIIINLISNAIKFVPMGGRIFVRIERAPITKESDSPHLRIAVIDNGPGIAPEILPHITTPFFAATLSKNKETGSGLGLSISKSLAEAMEGSLTIESAIDEGTTIIVDLPAMKERRASPRPIEDSYTSRSKVRTRPESILQ